MGNCNSEGVQHPVASVTQEIRGKIVMTLSGSNEKKALQRAMEGYICLYANKVCHFFGGCSWKGNNNSACGDSIISYLSVLCLLLFIAGLCMVSPIP